MKISPLQSYTFLVTSRKPNHKYILVLPTQVKSYAIVCIVFSSFYIIRTCYQRKSY